MVYHSWYTCTHTAHAVNEPVIILFSHIRTPDMHVHVCTYIRTYLNTCIVDVCMYVRILCVLYLCTCVHTCIVGVCTYVHILCVFCTYVHVYIHVLLVYVRMYIYYVCSVLMYMCTYMYCWCIYMCSFPYILTYIVFLLHCQICSMKDENEESAIASLLHNQAALKLLCMGGKEPPKDIGGTGSKAKTMAEKRRKMAEMVRSLDSGRLSNLQSSMESYLRSMARSLGIFPLPHIDPPSLFTSQQSSANTSCDDVSSCFLVHFLFPVLLILLPINPI